MATIGELEFAVVEETAVGVGQDLAEASDQGGLLLGLRGPEGRSKSLAEQAAEAVGGLGGVERLDVAKEVRVEGWEEGVETAVYDGVVKARRERGE